MNDWRRLAAGQRNGVHDGPVADLGHGLNAHRQGGAVADELDHFWEVVHADEQNLALLAGLDDGAACADRG